MPQILSDRIIFDVNDWLGGMIAPIATGTGAIRILGEQGHAFHSNYNPVDSVHDIPGVAASGPGNTDLTNVDSNSPLSIIIDGVVDGTSSVNKAYGLNGSQVEEWNTSSDALTVSGGTFPHAITPHGHSSLSTFGCQLVPYNQSDTRKLFYSWSDGTDWDVGTFDYTSTFDDDFMSTVPTTPIAGADLTDGDSVPHPLFRSSQDDLLYMGSLRYVHYYDGLNNTFTSQAFDMGSGWRCIGFQETQYDLVIFAGESTSTTNEVNRCRAFFWDQSRPSSAYKILDIDAYRISAPFRYKGTIGCFGTGPDNSEYIYLYDGNEFVKVAEYDGAGNLPVNGGVIVNNGLLKFMAGGKIYSWGKYKNLLPPPTNPYHIATLGGTGNGLCKQLFANRVYMSSEAGELVKFANFGQGSVATRTAYPNFPKGMKGKVKQVDVEFAQTTTAAKDTVDIDLQEDLTVVNLVSSFTSATQTKMKFLRDENGNPFKVLTGLSAILTWNAGAASTDSPAIKRITVWYDPVSDATA